MGQPACGRHKIRIPRDDSPTDLLAPGGAKHHASALRFKLRFDVVTDERDAARMNEALLT
eukprot:5955028-Amphidinium_carterae.1